MVQLLKINSIIRCSIDIKVACSQRRLTRNMDSESREEATSRALASGGTVIIGHLQAVATTLLPK